MIKFIINKLQDKYEKRWDNYFRSLANRISTCEGVISNLENSDNMTKAILINEHSALDKISDLSRCVTMLSTRIGIFENIFKAKTDKIRKEEFTKQTKNAKRRLKELTREKNAKA